MYNELIEQHDLYASFVESEGWKNHLKAIKRISADAANAVDRYGIGTKVADSGEYDFESGQLLDNMPIEVRNGKAVAKAYEAICELAHSYAEFVRNYKAE